MIGKLTSNGTAVVTMTDAGDWEPAAEEYKPVAAILNASCHPLKHSEVGDHHLPFGIMAMNRAAQRLGFRVELEREIPPLPPGAIS